MKKIIRYDLRRFIGILALLHSFLFSYYHVTQGITVYLSSQHNCSEALCRYIDNAKTHVDFAMYIMTDKQICSALIRAAERGVAVRGIIDKSNIKIVKKLHTKKLVKSALNTNGLMHHKFMIIDRKYLLTGSYNYTYSADNKNDENFLIIKDKRVIMHFLHEFVRMWDDQ